MASLAQTDKRFVDPDADQPAGEATGFRELAKMGEGLDVGLLHHLLHLGFHLEQRSNGAKEALVVASHQHLEQLGLAGEYSRHDDLVGRTCFPEALSIRMS